MKAAAAFLVLANLSLGTLCVAQSAGRPSITGVDHVDFYTTDPTANAHFYSGVLGLAQAKPVEPRQTQRFVIGTQWVGYSPAPDANSKNRLDHVAFVTSDAAGMKAYLAGKNVKVPDALTTWRDGSKSFLVKDPEDHWIEFIQRGKSKLKGKGGTAPVSYRLMHAGFVVHDRDAENKFFIDILGFRPYWYGGMKDDRTDWVALLVPDGPDWVEYMLNVKPDAEQSTIGVMNHIALGVADIKHANAELESHGWKPSDREKMQLGRDGKYQLNLYDPDKTRVELMEFKPKEKPCCSDFTAPHPDEK
jgi:catechol 2,3-dioxygenase-like lactoylglutathione lyase family enzyme